MKKLLASFVSLSLLLAACTASPATPLPSTATSQPDLFDTPWDDRSPFRAGLVSSEQSVLDELPDASVYHLEFNIADDLYHITGTEEVRYTNAEDVALSEVHLRLFPNILGGEMTVTNVTVDEQAVTPRLELGDSLLIVPLPSPLEAGQSMVLQMGLFPTAAMIKLNRSYFAQAIKATCRSWQPITNHLVYTYFMAMQTGWYPCAMRDRCVRCSPNFILTSATANIPEEVTGLEMKVLTGLRYLSFSNGIRSSTIARMMS